MKKPLVFLVSIFAMTGIIFGIAACGKNSFLGDRGKSLNSNKEIKNGTGNYSTVAKEYASGSDDLVDLDSIFAVGKDVLITVDEVKQAEMFYTSSGYDKAEAEKTVISYMEKYNSLYVEALKNGYYITDEEINAKIEELKKMFSESDQTDELKKLMNEFESEEAYWKYEYEVYKKSLPIEKYRIFLEKEFSEKETSEKGSEEYQNEWIKWYDTYQEDLAKEQNFIVVSEMEEGALVELLERFITD